MPNTSKQSPFAAAYADFIENGYTVVPIAPPGEPTERVRSPGRQPAEYINGALRPISRAPDLLNERTSRRRLADWAKASDLGIGIVIPESVVAIDVDDDYLASLLEGLGDTRKVGSKGFTAFFKRPAFSMERHSWRVEDGSRPMGRVVLDVLCTGDITTMPPSIHWRTGQPYRYDPSGLDHLPPIDELPSLRGSTWGRIREALDRVNAQTGSLGRETRASRSSAAFDNLPRGRKLNDLAFSDLDQWVPDLGLPGTIKTSANSYRVIPTWRQSGSGRATSRREPNLSITGQGAQDFGTAERYTAIDIVMNALSMETSEAMEWLEGRFGIARMERASGSDVELDIAGLIRSAKIQAEAEDDPGYFAHEDESLSPAADAVGDIDDDTIRAQRKMSKIFRPALTEPMPDISDAFCGPLENIRGAIYHGSARRHMGLASMLSIAALGAAMSRRYWTETRLPPSTYLFGVMPSGSGKTSALKAMREIFVRAGLENLLMPSDVRSASGVRDALRTQPRLLLVLDEMGKKVKNWTGPRASNAAAEIMPTFTEIWSLADSSLPLALKATVTRRAEEQMGAGSSAVSAPCLSLVGMGTPGQMWSSLSGAMIEDGMLARFILFDCPERGETVPPSDDADKWLALASESLIEAATPDGDLGTTQLTPPTPIVLELSVKAEELRLSLSEMQEEWSILCESAGAEDLASIAERLVEQTLRLALVFSYASGQDNIDSRSFELASRLTIWSVRRMIAAASTQVGDTDWERYVQKILGSIEKAGEAGISARNLVRKIRSRPMRDLTAAIDQLYLAGQIIRARKPAKNGRLVDHYYLDT